MFPGRTILWKLSPNDCENNLYEYYAGYEYPEVAVEVRVLSVSQQTVQVVRESPIKRQEITVADSTAAMKLTIWEELVSKLEVDKSYKILHLSTRLFQNAKSITSTKQTTISQIPDIINCAPAIDSDVITKEGKITQEGLTYSYLCDNCKSKVDFSNQKFVRCQSCKLKMTKESLHRSISGTFSVLIWKIQTHYFFFSLVNISNDKQSRFRWQWDTWRIFAVKFVQNLFLTRQQNCVRHQTFGSKHVNQNAHFVLHSLARTFAFWYYSCYF